MNLLPVCPECPFHLVNRAYLAGLETPQKYLIVIAGPTAVGKTALAIQLAEFLKTEIVSADSRQIFREMTIGTAKPSGQQLEMVPHHFINNHSIAETYDAAQYGRDALVLIHSLFEKYNSIVLVGGSGLYIKAVCEGFDDIPEVPGDIRQRLTDQYEQHGLLWLQQQMLAMDAEHFASIDQQNPHRLMRALEVKLGTGMSISEFQKKRKLEHPFSILKIGLETERDELYKRIDYRMDSMIAQGLFDEASTLYPYKDHQALKTVGYQEIFDFMDGKYDREEAIRLLKRNSRRYAKRQLTWFKRDEEMQWFGTNAIDPIVSMLRSRFQVPS